MDVDDYSLKQLLGTNKALRGHDGKLQKVVAFLENSFRHFLLETERRLKSKYRAAVKHE